ncbi:MAG: C39 family peptidase [Nitrospira sp.]|nr:C39 family peptidase [Nitrospira sp.]
MAVFTNKVKSPWLINLSFLLLILFITTLVSGCSAYKGSQEQFHFYDNYPANVYISSIPFFPQEDFQCGPAALASLLNYLGYKVLPDEISRAIFSEKLNGTLQIDMVSYAKRYQKEVNLSAEELQGTLEILKKDLLNSVPVIVFVDNGFWKIRKGHYMLVTGYDDKRGGVIVYSGKVKDKFIAYSAFMRKWERGGYWALHFIPS